MIEYGPLTALAGNWKGTNGVDVSPEPDGVDTSPYSESIQFEPCGDVTNAAEQRLVVVRYLQVVRKKSDNQVFHDQTGYWLWEPETGLVMQSLVIPRGVSLTAGGQASTDANGDIVLSVSASVESEDWGIVQPPFMASKAKTVSYNHCLTLSGNKLSYNQTILLDIYGKSFEHTDHSELEKTVD